MIGLSFKLGVVYSTSVCTQLLMLEISFDLDAIRESSITDPPQSHWYDKRLEGGGGSYMWIASS